MTGFSAEWLSLRAAVDREARNAALARNLPPRCRPRR